MMPPRGSVYMSKMARSFSSLAISVLLAVTVVSGAALSEPSDSVKCATNEQTAPGYWSKSILYNGTVVTMEGEEGDIQIAEAVAIEGDHIIAVGSDDYVLAFQDPSTHIVDLCGSTVLPGFIDSHSHALTTYEYTCVGAPFETGQRWVNTFGNPGIMKGVTVQDAIRVTLKGGWTSISELFVKQGHLDSLLSLDAAGELGVRVNAYLALNSGFERFGNWYTAYPPGQEFSTKLRVGGVKIFADEAYYGRFALLSQEDLAFLVSKAHSEGYQIAIHAMDKGIDMVLNVYQQVLQGEQDPACRDRLEHLAVTRDDQLSRMAQLGLIASFQMTWFTSNPWDIWDVKKYIGLDRVDLVGRWHDIVEAGIPSIGSTDFPNVYDTDNSAMAAIYKAVTRIGHPGLPPPQWELDQRITVERALRLLTIDAAYGTFQEDVKGSIAVGKLADLVVLSDNPLAIPPESLMDISVLMTMVGGQVEYCAPGHEYLYGSVCPTSLASIDYGTFSNTALPNPTEGLVVASETITSFKENV